MTLIDTILNRIANNNEGAKRAEDGSTFYNMCYGRVEAYEDVLRVLGYYDDQDEVIAR